MSQLGLPFYGLTLNPEDKVRIHEEIFNLVYHSNGGFSHDEAYSMPVFLRYFNLKMLLNQKQKEKEAAENKPENTPPPVKGPPITKVLPRNTSNK